MNLGQFKTGGMEQRDHSGPIASINQSYIILKNKFGNGFF